MVIRWTNTFKLRIHVDSTSTFTLRLVRWIFYVKSTSNLRLKVSVRTCFIFQCRNVPVHEACRFINVEYTSIPRRGFPTEQVDSSTLKARRFYVEISQSITPVDSQRRIYVDFTSKLSHGASRFFDVECTSIWRSDFLINNTCRFFNFEYTAIHGRGFPTLSKNQWKVTGYLWPRCHWKIQWNLTGNSVKFHKKPSENLL